MKIRKYILTDSNNFCVMFLSCYHFKLLEYILHIFCFGSYNPFLDIYYMYSVLAYLILNKNILLFLYVDCMHKTCFTPSDTGTDKPITYLFNNIT